MIITTTVTETKQVEKEMDLPYYAKSGLSFFRINENESITAVVDGDMFFSINTSTREMSRYGSDLATIVDKYDRSNHAEFMKAIESVRAKTEHAMTAELLKQAI